LLTHRNISHAIEIPQFVKFLGIFRERAFFNHTLHFFQQCDRIDDSIFIDRQPGKGGVNPWFVRMLQSDPFQQGPTGSYVLNRKTQTGQQQVGWWKIRVGFRLRIEDLNHAAYIPKLKCGNGILDRFFPGRTLF